MSVLTRYLTDHQFSRVWSAARARGVPYGIVMVDEPGPQASGYVANILSRAEWRGYRREVAEAIASVLASDEQEYERLCAEMIV